MEEVGLWEVLEGLVGGKEEIEEEEGKMMFDRLGLRGVGFFFFLYRWWSGMKRERFALVRDKSQAFSYIPMQHLDVCDGMSRTNWLCKLFSSWAFSVEGPPKFGMQKRCPCLGQTVKLPGPSLRVVG